MTDINLKTLTPDTSLPTTGFLFGADSQASTNPSVYSTQTVATTLLGSTSLTGDTVATSLPVLDLAQTWNSSGTTFTGVRFNAAGSSSTNSAAASLLLDLQVGGTTRFLANKSGQIELNSTGASADKVILNSSASALKFNISRDYNPVAIIGSYGAFNNILGLSQDASIGWTSTDNNAQGTFSTFLRRSAKGAANIQLGAADAASPVAQTLSVQSIVGGLTGTPNLSAAAYPFTITGAQGTGTGAGGSIIFQVAPAGGSGSAQNALATALTINSDRSITGYTNANLFSQTAVNINGCLYGNEVVGIGKNMLINMSNNGVGLTLASLMPLSWGPNNNVTDYANLNNPDVKLYRDNSNILALKNSTNAQEFRVYETTTGSIYKALLGNRQLMKISGASFTDGAGSSAGTITNAPAVGNPTKWIPIDDNGTTRYIPAW